MMDGFLGYKQVKVKKEEQYKTIFTTPQGTYVYVKMPFGLTNGEATFQRAMDVAFDGLIHFIMVVYQDNLTTISKKVEDHCKYLEKSLKELQIMECL